MKLKAFPKSSGRFSETHYAAYYKQKDMTVLKMYPRKRNKDEWSDRQRNNRARFLLMSKFAKMNLHSLIRPVWNVCATGGLNGYNRFIKENKEAFDFEGQLRFPDKLMLSFGDLPSVIDFSASLDKWKNVMHLRWKSNDNNPLKRKYDHLCYVVLHINEPLKVVHTDAKRWNDKACIELEEDLSVGDRLFFFFSNIAASEFSCSFSVLL